MDQHCHAMYGHHVRLVLRNNTCLDWESLRVELEYAEMIGRPAVLRKNHTSANTATASNEIIQTTNTSRITTMMTSAYYDFLVYLNCGVTGPSPDWATVPWFNLFSQGRHKITGLSLNCEDLNPVHIQSMMYAMDREGLQVIYDGGAIFYCTSTKRPSYKQEYNKMDKFHYMVGCTTRL